MYITKEEMEETLIFYKVYVKFKCVKITYNYGECGLIGFGIF